MQILRSAPQLLGLHYVAIGLISSCVMPAAGRSLFVDPGGCGTAVILARTHLLA
jgi:hypothetical protein